MNASQARDVAELLSVGHSLVDELELWLEIEEAELPHAGMAATYVQRSAQTLQRLARRGARSLAGDTLIPGKHDPAARRRGVRKGAERGCWVYLTAELLERAGFDPYGDPPYYRTWSGGRSGVVLRLYREA